MNKMTGNRVAENLSERGKLLKNYNGARQNLLFIIILTIVNIVLIVSGTGTYFLFSASIPFSLGMLGLSSLIHFDAELSAALAEANILPGSAEYEYYMSAEYAASEKAAYVVLIAIAVVILALYFVAWLKSKKPEKNGWMIFALVLFAIDTVAMVIAGEAAVESIADIVLHVCVIIYFIVGIVAASKLKKLPPEEELAEDAAPDVSGPYVAPSADEVIDPGFTYPSSTSSTLNGESVDTKNEKL